MCHSDDNGNSGTFTSTSFECNCADENEFAFYCENDCCDPLCLNGTCKEHQTEVHGPCCQVDNSANRKNEYELNCKVEQERRVFVEDVRRQADLTISHQCGVGERVLLDAAGSRRSTPYWQRRHNHSPSSFSLV